jgi:hypothetical protein
MKTRSFAIVAIAVLAVSGATLARGGGADTVAWGARAVMMGAGNLTGEVAAAGAEAGGAARAVVTAAGVIGGEDIGVVGALITPAGFTAADAGGAAYAVPRQLAR